MTNVRQPRPVSLIIKGQCSDKRVINLNNVGFGDASLQPEEDADWVGILISQALRTHTRMRSRHKFENSAQKLILNQKHEIKHISTIEWQFTHQDEIFFAA